MQKVERVSLACFFGFTHARVTTLDRHSITALAISGPPFSLHDGVLVRLPTPVSRLDLRGPILTPHGTRAARR